MAGKQILGLVWAERNPGASGSRARGVPEMRFAPWCVEPSPGSPGGCTEPCPGSAMAQWVLRQQASRWWGCVSSC